MLAMLGQMGGLAFGSQLGRRPGPARRRGADLARDVGLPVGPGRYRRAAAGEHREVHRRASTGPRARSCSSSPPREAAHQRLFTHVPWLRERLLGAVEEYARGITVDTLARSRSWPAASTRANPGASRRPCSRACSSQQTTPEQQVALARLETLLALVEGWVDAVVAEAVGDRLPGADALRETLRRRRASGGPAEQTFATLVGLELRPRRLRDAAGAVAAARRAARGRGPRRAVGAPRPDPVRPTTSTTRRPSSPARSWQRPDRRAGEAMARPGGAEPEQNPDDKTDGRGARRPRRERLSRASRRAATSAGPHPRRLRLVGSSTSSPSTCRQAEPGGGRQPLQVAHRPLGAGVAAHPAPRTPRRGRARAGGRARGRARSRRPSPGRRAGAR